jgi:aminoglycoside/choline kinase family phosphotransferase
MLVDSNNPGVIDYQDAVIGPVTYDLVSLFKDCYIEWPRNKVEQWLDRYLQLTSINIPADRNQFIRWFDLMGVQRHLKVLGIFARLNYRDGKSQYLDDLPLTLKYVVDACKQYDELLPLLNLLQSTALQHPEVTY